MPATGIQLGWNHRPQPSVGPWPFITLLPPCLTAEKIKTKQWHQPISWPGKEKGIDGYISAGLLQEGDQSTNNEAVFKFEEHVFLPAWTPLYQWHSQRNVCARAGTSECPCRCLLVRGHVCVSSWWLGADSRKKELVGRDDRGGWQLFLCGKQSFLFVHLLVGDVGISHFLRGQMGCACKERSGNGGYRAVSTLWN